MKATARLLNIYRETHYDLRMPGGNRVTLRVGNRVPQCLLEWANGAWPLVYISACNPRSVRLPKQINRQRMRTLLHRLSLQSVRVLAGVGHIPGQGWRESSLLVVGLTMEQTDLLAIEFAQNAVVIACKDEPVDLRGYFADEDPPRIRV